MTAVFRDAPFKTTNGTTSLTLNDRYTQVIDVKEFANLHTGSGSLGSGEGDDAPCIQAALNAAFGDASAPHGYNDRRLNRPVRIQNGRYFCNSPLNLTRVVGGLIYGVGAGPTEIRYGVEPVGGATLTPLLNINGAVGLTIRDIVFEMGGGGGTFTGLNNCAMNIDWDGVAGATGGGGLRFNHFENLGIGGGEYVVIVGRAGGLEGQNQLFMNCTIGASLTGLGMDIRGPKASVGMIGGGVTAGEKGGVRCPAGGGSFFGQGMAPTGNFPDFIMESDGMMHIAQMRSESWSFLRMESGIVHAQAVQWAGAGKVTGPWVSTYPYPFRLTVERLGTKYWSKMDGNLNFPPESNPDKWEPFTPQVVVNGGVFTYEISQISDIGGARISGSGGEVHAMLLYNAADPNTFEDYAGTLVEFGVV